MEHNKLITGAWTRILHASGDLCMCPQRCMGQAMAGLVGQGDLTHACTYACINITIYMYECLYDIIFSVHVIA